MRLCRSFLLLVLLASPAGLPAQNAPAGKVPFTPDDIVKVVTASVLDLSDDGRHVAVAARRLADNAEVDNGRYGDPTYVSPSWVRLLVIDTATGAVQAPFKELVNVQQASWSPDGRRLAVLTATNAGAPKIGQPSLPVTRLWIWDTERAALADATPRGELAVSANSSLGWHPDNQRLTVTCRPAAWERDGAARFAALTQGPVIVHTSKDPFLEWDALRRGLRRRVLAEIDVTTGQLVTLVPDSMITSYAPARDGSFVMFIQDVTEKTDYDEIGGAVNDVRVVAKGAAVRTVAAGKDLKGLQLRWSDDGRRFAYAKKGEVFVQGIDEAKARSLTPDVATARDAAAKEGAEPKKEPDAAAPAAKDAKKDEPEQFSVVSFSRDASRLLVTSKKGWYILNSADGARRRLMALDLEKEEQSPRIEATSWSPDGQAIYATWSARDKWERGLVRLDSATGDMKPLVRDARLYGGFRLSRDGRTFVFTRTDGDTPAELYAANADFTSVRKLTDLNPWMTDRALPRSELVSYRDSDGKQLYGVLRYPVNYEKGRNYPTVFEIYETFFDNGFNARAALLANRGYAVFHPSVNLVVGRPGEAWVKGVTSAANRLIDMGIADPDKLGVQGTSYGGYATALLITQTDRFKAAINISGKVNMISFYTDSPRLGVRNIHAPEKSQDRLGATLWERPERYLEHSAILRADRVKTPLLCITGDLDPNVPASQSREMYYALRRLGKEVEWVRYATGAHRPPNSVAETLDFEARIVGWYDKYLKGM
ncbi:MAG: S9 family peptidase [Acidobacteria bacterium]|nr:MAG: S9 family peptidase [Acidobacteriota bacterium]